MYPVKDHNSSLDPWESYWESKDPYYYSSDYYKRKQMNKIVVVTASWCGPCKTYKPMLIENDAEIKATGYEVEIVDADEQMDRCRTTLGVRGVPTTIIYKDGVEISRLVGNQSKEALFKELK